jgi:indole-3-glycerol phosphate synthase
MPAPTYLDAILEHHLERASADGRDLGALKEEALALAEDARAVGEVGGRRGFAEALRAGREGSGLRVIAEIKRRSPSKGHIAPALDARAIAREYEAAGAACMSVLTDERFFGGSTEDLRIARSSTKLPVLRKDFIVSAKDVCESKIMGADALLLIVAALDGDLLNELLALASELKMDALVEVHDEEELSRSLEAGAELVGVNQRDLRTFAVDPGRARALVSAIPEECVAVAESGISNGEEAAGLAAAGYDAVLVGESLVCASDRSRVLASLSGHPIGARSTLSRSGPVTAAGSYLAGPREMVQ